MHGLLDSLPWLIGMGLLIGCSAFFSGSEASLFYLRRADRQALANGTAAQRAAERLLADPERLLTAVLFWNLTVNIAYFAIVAIVGLRLERHPQVGQTGGVIFATLSLLAIIFLSEMVPKSIAVLQARRIAGFVGIPLASFVRLIDPIMPTLRAVSDVSRRLLMPGIVMEKYLELDDLQHAINVSHDVDLLDQERAVLRNIVALSDIRVEEWMRPRSKLVTFRAPVPIADLGGRLPPTGYALIADGDNDDIVGSVNLHSLADFDEGHLEKSANDVIFAPWCAPVAETFQQMQRTACDVTVVVNELGETIGVLTLDQIIHAVLTDQPGRGEGLLNRAPLRQIREGIWEVDGVTNIRRLARTFEVTLPTSRHVTVSGVVQETLERLPVVGDECVWGPFCITVMQVKTDSTLFQMRLANREDAS